MEEAKLENGDPFSAKEDWTGRNPEKGTPDGGDEQSSDGGDDLSDNVGVSSKSDWHGGLAATVESADVVVFVGTARDVVKEIRGRHCSGDVTGSVLRKHVSARKADVSGYVQSGRWKYLICTSFDEASDFQRYVVQQLEPILGGGPGDWKQEYGVLYQRFLRELEASEALGCHQLDGRPFGPGVFVYYHEDKLFWESIQADAEGEEPPSEKELLRRGIGLIHLGKILEGSEILVDLITANPRNEMAWLWYAYALPHTEDRIKALEECLYFNPDCQEAKDRLIFLKTNEALRQKVQERKADTQGRIDRVQSKLVTLRDDLRGYERELEDAELRYAEAKENIERSRRDIASLEAELEHFQEQLDGL